MDCKEMQQKVEALLHELKKDGGSDPRTAPLLRGIAKAVNDDGRGLNADDIKIINQAAEAWSAGRAWPEGN